MYCYLLVFFAQVIGNFNLAYPYIAKKISFYISSASFYLPAARAWELLCGYMVAIYLDKKNNLNNKFFDHFVFWYYFNFNFNFFYDKNIPYTVFIHFYL